MVVLYPLQKVDECIRTKYKHMVTVVFGKAECNQVLDNVLKFLVFFKYKDKLGTCALDCEFTWDEYCEGFSSVSVEILKRDRANFFNFLDETNGIYTFKDGVIACLMGVRKFAYGCYSRG